jgi:histidine triad (HIT) family protein
MSETIFDRIVRGEAEADIVYEDEEAVAFRDINPQAPTHVLVIPKDKLRSFADLRDQDPARVGAFFVAVSTVAARLGLEKRGYRIVLNCGRHGQQSVDYLHAHILGGRQLRWPPG